MSEHKTATEIQRDISATLGWPRPWYALLMVACVGAVVVGGLSWAILLKRGFGTTGLNEPVMWAIPIASFIFWVGIAHSGTLISAILFLFRARFRTSIYRISETMTVFAVLTAGLWPIIHLGRAWLFFWLFPYPNQRELWVNFRSPLIWDVFAVLTYLTISALFLFTGLIPDAAALRDAKKGWKRRFYAIFSLGWRGSDGEWRRFNRGYLFFAALATPLVISVHSVVSWDFAMSIRPGWHSTIFAPYFVAGAILSGVAMVITILIPLRKSFGLHDYVKPRHFDMLARLLMLTSIIVTYSYASEYFIAFYGDNETERDLFLYRLTGPYAPFVWTMIICNCVVPLACFWRRVRSSLGALLAISILVNVGMYLERYNIVVTSLAHSYEPFAWGHYTPSWIEGGLLLGSFGWFGMWLLLFVKIFPAVALAEMKEAQAHES